MLVLRLLSQASSYGYELVTRLQDQGLANISTGTVYPVLTRLERDGLLSSELVPSNAGPARKYYQPTPAGLAAMKADHTSWLEILTVVANTFEEI